MSWHSFLTMIPAKRLLARVCNMIRLKISEKICKYLQATLGRSCDAGELQDLIE